MPKQKTSAADQLPIPVELIARRIYRIRGEKVMLDSDLAELYRVSTGNPNLAVRRNVDRFPEDFMFELTKDEHNALLLQLQEQELAAVAGRLRPTPSPNTAWPCSLQCSRAIVPSR